MANPIAKFECIQLLWIVNAQEPEPNCAEPGRGTIGLGINGY
jgi:hypothetical protein